MQTTQKMTKHLLNNLEECVDEAVEGALLLNPSLLRVEGFNALVRADIQSVRDQQVSILSGGGSGHEPAHAGFIGPGMLSGAVLGNVFASPSVAAILATLRCLAGSRGVLLIVKNYTGDRINFGLAMEQARQLHIACEMVIVDDDVALQQQQQGQGQGPQHKGITGGRGVAGTLLIHKIAGASAQRGLSLSAIATLCQQTVRRLRSLGVALTPCAVPGNHTAPSQRLRGAREAEIGMGIHGEPGRETTELPLHSAARFVAETLVDAVLPTSVSDASCGCVLLLNNLGALPVLEMAVVARDVLLLCAQRGVSVRRVYCGSLMTALDMRGVSLSSLQLCENGDELELLDAHTAAPAWPAAAASPLSTAHFDLSRRVLKVPDCFTDAVSADNDNAGEKPSKQSVMSGSFVGREAVELCLAISRRIVAIEPQLSAADLICGDGDCGIVMKKGATRLATDMAQFDGLDRVDAACFCDVVATALSLSMGGSSGVLLELACRAMSNHFLQSVRTVLTPFTL
jgi:triose/dihydroxyacetone kinase / FAD-AMP lyase (cyclizing)